MTQMKKERDTVAFLYDDLWKKAKTLQTQAQKFRNKMQKHTT